MRMSVLAAAGAGMFVQVPQAGACAVYQDLSPAAATGADVVFVGHLKSYELIGADGLLTFRVAE